MIATWTQRFSPGGRRIPTTDVIATDTFEMYAYSDYARLQEERSATLRACESAIDLAMHIVASERLGVPQESGDAFTLLETAHRIDVATANAMRRMVGFRNIAVHEYQEINRPILISILEHNLDDNQLGA